MGLKTMTTARKLFIVAYVLGLVSVPALRAEASQCDSP
jgi:hypothetical protein